jgi:hypothetical protein
VIPLKFGVRAEKASYRNQSEEAAAGQVRYRFKRWRKLARKIRVSEQHRRIESADKFPDFSVLD